METEAASGRFPRLRRGAPFGSLSALHATRAVFQ